jgi:DegV family protein with EDD domain
MSEEQQSRIAIVTDSTADIPADLVQELGIHVVPQILIMGDRTWRDGVDIDAPAFYQLLQTSEDFPSSSQPSIASFQDLFNRLSRDYDSILAILVSDELSGTINSATLAAQQISAIPIEIVDSRSVSLQLGLIVLQVARQAAAGSDLETLATMARSMISRSHVYFVVDTLEYLHRNGRIGGAARLLGSALDLKPVLQISDGAVAPLTRVRTRKKALAKVQELLEQQISGGDRVRLGILNIDCREDAARLGQRLRERFDTVELLENECSPVVGTHAGPGTVGVAFFVE